MALFARESAVTVKSILQLALPWRWHIVLLTLIMLAESLVSLTMPWLTGRLADNVLSGTLDANWGLALKLIGLLFLVALLRTLTTILSGHVSLGILTDLRSWVHAHVIGLPLSFHQESKKGDLMSLMTWEVGQLSNYLTTTLASVLPSLVTAVGAIFMMAQINMFLAFVIPCVLPLFYIATKLAGRRVRGLSTNVQATEAAVMASAQETLEILPAIKTFTREPETFDTYRTRLAQARRAALQQLSAHAVISPATQFIAGSAAIILLGLAGKAVATEGLDTAGLVSFMLYAALLTRPVSILADIWGKTQVVRGLLVRLEKVMATPVEKLGARRLGRVQGRINVQNLSFAYPGRPTLFHDIHLSISAGECIALTGPNGAGKTTLTALLMGLSKFDHGQILLDEQDITEISLRNLRQQFGHVPQRPLLFNASIRENIAFGLPDASEAQIYKAAAAAQADVFIKALPQGYDTIIGDAGVRLSGGQSQRIALARALIKDPPILVLDEATSMYDLEGESAFVSAAKTALAGRTVILITHRPATLALAERILVLENGKLSEIT